MAAPLTNAYVSVYIIHIMMSRFSHATQVFVVCVCPVCSTRLLNLSRIAQTAAPCVGKFLSSATDEIPRKSGDQTKDLFSDQIPKTIFLIQGQTFL